MSETPTDKPTPPDGETLDALQQRFADLQAESMRVFNAMMQADPKAGVEAAQTAQQTAVEVSATLAQRPEKLLDAQAQFWSGITDIWQRQAAMMTGDGEIPETRWSTVRDKRFRDANWSENPIYDSIKQIYLLASDCVTGLVDERDDLSDEDRNRLNFYSRQYIDALAPTNTLFGNPEVLEETVRTNGENLLRGLENLAADVERGGGKLAISRTVDGAFEVGRNLATTPGQVVFRNEYFELIQYAPTTEQVYARPLVIVPPWINKFYILDLQAHNSFIRYAVAQGQTVFVVSWVNPTAEHRDKKLEDYMAGGVLTAVAQAAEICDRDDVNLIGYCIGGTLSAGSLAHLAAAKRHPIASATFFTTLTDFENAGELKLFTTATEIDKVEETVAELGYLPAENMAEAFNVIRANDLVWSYVVNNYLRGRKPTAFDILHWNGDSTRMPGGLHVEYLRNLYLHNLMIEPGALSWGGQPIDLGAIDVPTYMLSTEQDHIAPWVATYEGYRRWGGNKRFVLAESGHVAGVINPADADGFKPGKYGHYLGPKDLPDDPEAWRAAAEKVPASWWGDWAAWISGHGDGKVSSRQPINGLCDAPGTYVTAP